MLCVRWASGEARLKSAVALGVAVRISMAGSEGRFFVCFSKSATPPNLLTSGASNRGTSGRLSRCQEPEATLAEAARRACETPWLFKVQVRFT